MGPWYDSANDYYLNRMHEAGLLTDLDRHARTRHAGKDYRSVLPTLVAVLLVVGIGVFSSKTPPENDAEAQTYSSRP